MTNVEVRPILPADVRRLDSGNRPQIDEATIAALIVELPGASFWVPSTGEFVVVTRWRHRPELWNVHAAVCFHHEAPLLDAVIAEARSRSVALMHVDVEELRSSAFYDRHGFRRIEDIVTYEHRRPQRLVHTEVGERQRFVRLMPRDRDLGQAVQALDHAAFPWLWWNSAEEFDAYLRYPGVEVWAGLIDDTVRSYVGITHFRTWAHLDRIATDPRRQSSGLGRETLRFAASRMIANGARRIGLSTQGDNFRSRRLYESTGFIRTPEDDYTVRAVVFDLERMTAGPCASLHDVSSTDH